MKEKIICIISGVAGSCVTLLLGGWTEAMTTLLIFMAIDYITGLAVAFAGKSDKTADGKPSSKVGFRGIMRKGMMMLMLIVSCRLDLLIETTPFVRDSTCIAFIINETISIFENVGKFIDIPQVLMDTVERIIGKKSDKADSKSNSKKEKSDKDDSKKEEIENDSQGKNS